MSAEGRGGPSVAAVEEWLKKDGHTLEMRTLRQVRTAEPAFASAATYYPDINEAKAREIDVTASWATVDDEGAHYFVNLVVECKDMDGAWVLFRDDHDYLTKTYLRTLGVFQATVSRRDGQSPPAAVEYFVGEPVPELLAGSFNPCYGIKDFAGKGDGKPAGNNPGSAYAAARQALSAAFGLRQQVSSAGEDAGAAWWFPVVVTTAKLFVASLTENGATKVVETDYDSVAIPGPVGDLSAPTFEVHIVHESALPRFMEKFSELTLELLQPRNIILI